MYLVHRMSKKIGICKISTIQHPVLSVMLQLSMDLLRNYPAGYNVLPTANPHDVVNITLQMALYHIVDMVTRHTTDT